MRHADSSTAATASHTTPDGDARSVGAILIDSGMLRAQDAERVLCAQKDFGLRFGEAAIRIGLISAADLQQALSSQFDFPYLGAGRTDVSTELVAAFEPFSAQVETLRALRTQLILRWLDGGARKTVAVVGSARSEGRSWMAANLAIVFSQLGERTLLIDADLRHSRQHRLFNLDNASGLSSLLSGRSADAAVQRIGGFTDLSVLPAGTTPPNPQELLSRAGFARVLQEASHTYDVIVVDTPALASGAEAQTIAAQTGGVVALARSGHTRSADFTNLVDAMRVAGAVVIGSLLNHF